jgi:chromosome segregation ATPase
MNLVDIERLAGELLATGQMNEDTVADLERILGEARAGESYPDDLEYLQALHTRILSTDREIEADVSPAEDVVAQLRAEIARLEAELSDARQTIAELETRLSSGV